MSPEEAQTAMSRLEYALWLEVRLEDAAHSPRTVSGLAPLFSAIAPGDARTFTWTDWPPLLVQRRADGSFLSGDARFAQGFAIPSALELAEVVAKKLEGLYPWPPLSAEAHKALLYREVRRAPPPQPVSPPQEPK